MMYWMGVYLLVAIIVAGPFLLLYLLGVAVRQVVKAIGSAQDLTKARTFPAAFSRAHWNFSRRKAA
jgi:hypothetical protein